MAEDIAGRGDPIKTLQLMWGRVAPGTDVATQSAPKRMKG